LCYRTENGARSGDLYMALIHTAELVREEPFDCLVTLMRSARPVAQTPGCVDAVELPGNSGANHDRGRPAHLITKPSPPLPPSRPHRVCRIRRPAKFGHQNLPVGAPVTQACRRDTVQVIDMRLLEWARRGVMKFRDR
jgi:hypothetical protein